MTYILGITGPNAINPAACLIKDDKLIAMAEEERFTRLKHASGHPPWNAVNYCLRYARIKLDDVTIVGSGWSSASTHLLKQLFLAAKKPQILLYGPVLYKRYKKIADKEVLYRKKFGKKFSPNLHHLCHAASTFYVSGFKKSNILTIDGSGEVDATLLGFGNNQKINLFKTKDFTDSLGRLYALFTHHLGFKKDSHEGKVMGLASYGKPIIDGSKLIKFTKNDYSTSTFYRYTNTLKILLKNITKLNRNTADLIRDHELVELFGEKRNKDDKITKMHANIAATVQNLYEIALIITAKSLYDQTKSTTFCLAGGVALNCTGNGTLLKQDFVKDIFIQPASSDAGTALGAALLEYRKLGLSIKDKMEHAYYGPEYSNEEIKAALDRYSVKYTYYEDIELKTAKLLAREKLIGWFQGRMEVGPRALGNRSILANPSRLEMKDILNLRVKHREPWRPFAPSILAEAADEYLEDSYPSPFMLLSFRVRQEKWGEVPAIVHIDGTARPQTVTKKVNPRYYDLIKEFEKQTGLPLILNTSFNDKEEPLVCKPEEAIKLFMKVDLDNLAIGNYLVRK